MKIVTPQIRIERRINYEKIEAKRKIQQGYGYDKINTRKQEEIITYLGNMEPTVINLNLFLKNPSDCQWLGNCVICYEDKDVTMEIPTGDYYPIEICLPCLKKATKLLGDYIGNNEVKAQS